MRYAVARMMKCQARFFAGRLDDQSALKPMVPVTTGRPDQARTYEDKVVAEAMAAFFNELDSVHTGERTKPWIVMPLPEKWQ
jgi:hypothetical protein